MRFQLRAASKLFPILEHWCPVKFSSRFYCYPFPLRRGKVRMGVLHDINYKSSHGPPTSILPRKGGGERRSHQFSNDV